MYESPYRENESMYITRAQCTCEYTISSRVLCIKKRGGGNIAHELKSKRCWNRGKINTCNTPIHDHLLTWLGTGTSIKRGGIELVLWSQTHSNHGFCNYLDYILYNISRCKDDNTHFSLQARTGWANCQSLATIHNKQSIIPIIKEIEVIIIMRWNHDRTFPVSCLPPKAFILLFPLSNPFYGEH